MTDMKDGFLGRRVRQGVRITLRGSSLSFFNLSRSAGVRLASLKSRSIEYKPKIVSCFEVPLLHGLHDGNSNSSGQKPTGKHALGGT
jgi:hypothetical protein